MEKYLYFQFAGFSTNADFAFWLTTELEKCGYNLGPLADEGYMHVIPACLEGKKLNFYLGKNDEPTNPSTWQVWPEQKTGVLGRILGKNKTNTEEIAKQNLDKIIRAKEGVSSIEWSNI